MGVIVGIQDLDVLCNILISGKFINFYGQFSFATVLHAKGGSVPYFGKTLPTISLFNS